MDKKEKLLQKRVAGLFALLCVIFFQFFDSDHLFLKEEVVSVASLPEVLVGYWGKPAWLACSMAKVLTSLFVPVGGGAVLITAVLMLEWWASLFILRKFNVGDMAPLYALFPVVMEWGTYCSPYYHLNSILSLVIVLYIFCGYIQIKVKWLSWVTGFILLFAVYCMVGSRLFIFVILVLLYEAEIGEKHWVYWALLLITGTVYGLYLSLPDFYWYCWRLLRSAMLLAEKSKCFLHVFRRVDTDCLLLGDADFYLVAVFEPSELFQAFGKLQW